ncbi:hypothetical protein [Streptomyces sp. NPDC050534]|uniref:hypothetical protein n=1 Tax=Streptomyces sp. NPDC050534 TaxID=3365625 RepID=UPI00378F274B
MVTLLTLIVVAALAGCAIYLAQKDEKLGTAILVGVGVAALLIQLLGVNPARVEQGTPGQAPATTQTSPPPPVSPSVSVASGR